MIVSPQGPVFAVVERETCVGSATCVMHAPDEFELGDDGKSHPLRAETYRSRELVDAVLDCPVGAIVLRDATTREQLEVDG